MPLPHHARRCAAAVALVVFAAVAGFGLLAHREPPLPIPAGEAQRLASQQPKVRPMAQRATRVSVLRVDDQLVKVTFYEGRRISAWVGVRRDGSVASPAVFNRERVGYGAAPTHAPALLIAAAALFLLATLRAPLRRRRTLDALVLAAFAIPAFLIDRAWMSAAQVSAAVLLAYLVVVGVVSAWRGPGCDDPAEPSLLERASQRHGLPRLPAQLGAGLLVVTLLLTATSTEVIDVALANMEGATALLHGTLPYGNMPGDIVHGDTYGLPIYAFYAPFAAVWPMPDSWAEPTGSVVAGAFAVLVLAAGFERATRGSRGPALVALLTLPAGLMSITTGTNDVLVAAALVWTFAWFARPAASSAVLAMAGLAKVAPMILLPLWLARLRGAELARAVAACGAAGALVLAGLVAIGGLHGPIDMVEAMSFQLSRRSEMSVWTVVDGGVLQPLVQAVVLAVALGGAALVALDRSVAGDPRRVAGLVTAVLAGLQLAANHWMPLYLLWLVPPAMVALLGPLGAEAPATAPVAERARRRLGLHGGPFAVPAGAGGERA